MWRHRSFDQIHNLLETMFDNRKDQAMNLTVLEEMDRCPQLKCPKFVSIGCLPYTNLGVAAFLAYV